MTPDGTPPVRSGMRPVLGAAMWLLAVFLLVAVVAIIRDPGLWVVLLDDGDTIGFVLICLSGLLMAGAGPVFGLRKAPARGVGYLAAAVVTLCAIGSWYVSDKLDPSTRRSQPAQTVAVSADGRFEVVSRDALLGRPDLWLRSRAGLFSREAQEAIGCYFERAGNSQEEPMGRVEFTGPSQVTIRLQDGRSGTADFDGPTLIVTARQGGCAGPGPSSGR
ncbi:hypothetical protein [Catellatospora citrea]|uniref:Uncharacterized protein n=1 Tax=Catellatospora citrea TaxID=53366 RepID=A0A8J3NXJ5_9ACTN|nr:hypothetical protein [Catellatospora citrea]RKE11048.1 hypothetical protein C8E86_5968 [Catellatospora citrea]GIF96505.1 hypothetical protein Cci01nite_15990 [Catellatospora citrea]